MAQDYNVDDILEEIRRKKKREGEQPAAAARDTGTYYKEEYPSRTARQEVRPVRPQEKRETPVQQEFPSSARRDFSRIEPVRQDFSRAEPTRQHSEAGERRTRPSAFPTRASRQPMSERLLREEPFSDKERQPFSDKERQPSFEWGKTDEAVEAAPQRRTGGFQFSDVQQPESKPPLRKSFDFDAPDEFSDFSAAPPRHKSTAQRVDWVETAEPPLERATRDVPPTPPPDVQGNGFTFRASESQEEFELPVWEDEEELAVSNADYQEKSGFVDPTEVLLPDGGMNTREQEMRMDYTDNSFTREIDPPDRGSSYRQGKRARRRVQEEGPESIVQSQWQQSYAAQDKLEEQVEAEDDFTSPEDAAFVQKDIKSIRVGLSVKLALTGLLSMISVYLTLSLKPLPFARLLGLQENFLLALPTAIFPEENMRLFLIVNLVVCVLGAIVCCNIISGGISALCRMQADSDSPAALAMLGVLTQGITLILMPDSVYGSEHISLYFSVALLVLLFNLIGKLMLMRRIERNFEFLTSDAEKYAFIQIQSRDFAREFSKGLGPDVDRVAYSTPAGFFSSFLDKSYSADYSDSFSNLVVPITLVGAIVVGGATFFFAKDPAVAVSAFAAVLCITAPFSGSILSNLMLSRVSKKLTAQGAMLAGYESAEDYSDTSAVIISDKELYAEDCIMLHGMKVFAEKRIDEAILDAASVILSCNGIMSGVFLNMLGGKRELLKKVDSLMYEDSMGISAWVDGKRVLIGSRELMCHHEVDCPSRDFESRFVRDGRQVLYIANSGELSAMFVVSYNASPETAETLCELERRGIAFVVYSNDPNVTADRIASSFEIKRSSVKVLPAKLHGEYAYLVRPKERVAANGAHAGGLDGVLSLLKAACTVKQSVINGTILQLLGIIVGYGLVAFMAFTGSLSIASFGTLILFNLACLVFSVVAASVVKR